MAHTDEHGDESRARRGREASCLAALGDTWDPAELPSDLRETVAFHGHLCPGLVIGYVVAKAALERLAASRAEDEELIAIAENDSCSVDAVQWLTGCTFGKGNLFYRDHGKQVFTFALRPSGQAVRVSARSRARQPGAQREDRAPRIRRMLSTPAEELVDIRACTIALPAKARIRDSVTCDRCGESVMVTRTVESGTGTLCIPCAEGDRHP